MLVTDRDKEIIRLAHRFKFCLGRHIKTLMEFTGSRATDRRLKVLVEAGYLSRKKYLYGVPYLYTAAHKGRILIGVNKRENKIRLEQITHDIYVLDVLIFLKEKYRFSLGETISARELNIEGGFGTRKHQPDFVFGYENKKYAVEVELTPKAKANLERNVRDNYLNYDYQIWVTGDSKVSSMLETFSNEYSNIIKIGLESLQKCPDLK